MVQTYKSFQQARCLLDKLFVCFYAISGNAEAMQVCVNCKYIKNYNVNHIDGFAIILFHKCPAGIHESTGRVGLYLPKNASCSKQPG